MSATLINLPQAPSFSEPNSGPGTPMSGISTIAIKDGHEGSRPSNDGSVSGADRIQRLGLGMAYFDQTPAPRSPASSTATTSSTLEATKEAKMIDGMTYDEDVVDTTDRSPAAAAAKEKEEEEVVVVPRRRRRKQDEADDTGAETKAKV